MARISKDVVIGDNTYRITQMPGDKVVRKMLWLMKFGGIVAEGITSHGNWVSAVAVALVSQDDEEVMTFIKDLMGHITKNNVVINFNEEFAGNCSLLIDLVQESLMLNYGDVFTKLGFNFPQVAVEPS